MIQKYSAAPQNGLINVGFVFYKNVLFFLQYLMILRFI